MLVMTVPFLCIISEPIIKARQQSQVADTEVDRESEVDPTPPIELGLQRRQSVIIPETQEPIGKWE